MALAEQAKLPENWVVLEQAYRALQVQEDIIRNINEGDLSPEEKLRQIDIMLKGMINDAKHAINLYYNKLTRPEWLRCHLKLQHMHLIDLVLLLNFKCNRILGIDYIILLWV